MPWRGVVCTAAPPCDPHPGSTDDGCFVWAFCGQQGGGAGDAGGGAGSERGFCRELQIAQHTPIHIPHGERGECSFTQHICVSCTYAAACQRRYGVAHCFAWGKGWLTAMLTSAVGFPLSGHAPLQLSYYRRT